MNEDNILWLILSASLLLTSGLLFWAMGKMDFSKSSRVISSALMVLLSILGIALSFLGSKYVIIVILIAIALPPVCIWCFKKFG